MSLTFRTHRSRNGETVTRIAGEEAKVIRWQVRKDFEAAVDRWQADPTEANYAVMVRLSNTEVEIARRLEEQSRKDAA